MGSGRNSFVGWAEETTWGTAVAASKHGELVAESLTGIRTRTPRPVYRDLDDRSDALYDEKFGAAGGFTIELNYEGQLRLLEHIFGQDGVTTGAGPYLHTYNLQPGELANEGLTLELERDLGSGNCYQYAGGKIRSARFTFDPTRNAQVEVDMVFKDVALTTAAAQTFPPVGLYVAGHQASIEIDDVARTADSIELSIDNAIDDDKRILGSKQIDEPVRGDAKRQITGVITMDAVVADWSKFNAGTLFKLEILHSGPTTEGWDLTAAECLITEEPVNVTGPGLVKTTARFKVLKPSAGNMLTLVVTNSETAIA